MFRRALLVILFLAPACAVPEATDSSDSALAKPGSGPLVHRLPTGSESTLSVHSLPNATCQLQAVAPVSDPHTLKLYSDDDGVVRVHFKHLDAKVTQGTFSLDCTDDSGTHVAHSIALVVDDKAVPQAPAPVNPAGKPTLSQLGVYPPQPKAGTPEAATWNALTKANPLVLTPHIAVDQDRFHSNNTTSGNWSGYVLTSPATAPIYAWIYGEWNVPRAYAESGFYSNDHSSFWVGIDGFGSGDVVQDGTDQDTLTVFWVQSSSYAAWVEWFPLSSQTVSNFPVNPGDRIHAWTWLTDAAGNYTANPTVGRFYMWNATQNYYVNYSINLPSGTTFSGHSAEWVMERPTVGGSVSSLANYNFAQMTNAQVYDLWGGSHQYGGDASNTSWNVTMTNGSTILSTVAPVNSSTMSFTFHNHN